jgi:dephospho-CoA kinase
VIVVGLTGSIAMGKSTVAAMFGEFGVPTFNADDAVGEFYAGNGAKSIETAFPGVMVDGKIDRERLAARVLSDSAALGRLEGLVHPSVAKARVRFLERAAAEGRRMAVVDVPLLIETGGDTDVDLVMVVSAPEPIQRARAMAREGMTEAKLEAILARQASDAEKRRRAHFIIDTRGSPESTRAVVAQFMRAGAALTGGRRRDA